MKKVFLLFITAFLMLPFANASHVVGGDFQINMTSQVAGGAMYHIKLRVYRDDVNGIPMPASINCNVFQIGTNSAIGGNIALQQTSLGLVPLGDPCYTPDTNVVRIEEGIFETTTDVFIPDFAAGYYISASLNARNSLAINVVTGQAMTWFAMIPDPAIGQNSTPDFGNYPNDAYFCITGPKQFQYPITDADGDSLAYTLVEPLSSSSISVAPGSGAYPYYQILPWVATYSLANIVGGTPNMFINQTTGLITAAPTALGFFTFAIRVEEFRDLGSGVKVKIGEVRRDVQYISLNCSSGNPPSFLNVVPTNGGVLNFPYNYETCKDLIFNDINTTDTLYIEVISDIFDSNAYIATMIPNGSGDYTYYYNGNNGINPPTIWNDSVVIPPNDSNSQGEFNIGTIATRFCWTPKCNDIGKSYPFQINAFSLGCDGKTQDSIIFDINVVPPVVDFKDLSITGEIGYGYESCQDITFVDSSIVDLFNIDITSAIFGLGAEYPSLSNSYAYNDTVITGVANNAPNTKSLGTRFCWTPDCEHIGNTYNVRAVLSSVDCPTGIQDTIYFDYTVTPPFDTLNLIPNVFTPNNDGMNDVYKIDGISNPCNDDVTVEIYNRWGELVYDTVEPTFEWDGTNKGGSNLPSGTYFVIIKGIYGSESIIEEKRTITLLR